MREGETPVEPPGIVVDKASLIEWADNWRRRLVQDIHTNSCQTDQIGKVSRNVQRFLCKAIISQMLADRGLSDAEFIFRTPVIEPNIPCEALTQIQGELSEADLSGTPFEILSDIHESYLARKLVPNSSGELEYQPESKLRKGKGVYYTPRYIVQYIVDRTLGKYLWETEDGQPAGGMPVRTPDDIRHLRILDPACGSGCFLTYAFDVLAEFYSLYEPEIEPDWASHIIDCHLYGVDIDSDAVEMTSMILMLKALERIGQAPAAKPNIRQGNFLASVPSTDFGSFGRETESGGFTMILGNPPYGAKLTRTEREFIRSDYETYRSSDSSSLFVEKAVRILKDNGILGFIVPKSLSHVVSWQPIRRFLLDECRIAEVADTREAFKGVLLEQMVLIACKNGKPDAPAVVAQASLPVVSILRPERSVVSHSIPRSVLSAERFSIWLSSRRVRNIVDRMWENSVPLGHLAKIWNGLNARSLFTFYDKPGSERDCPCIKGRDIQRYYVREDMQYVRVTDAVEHHPPLEAFRRPRIIAQDIVAHIHSPRPHIKITATIDRSTGWLNANTVTNITSSEYSLEYLCGILNSRLISWYAYDFIYNRSIRTMHFRRGYADHIPIPRMDMVDKRIYEHLIEYVNQIISLHDEGAPESNIAAVDGEIDELVCQLYGITPPDLNYLKDSAGLYL